MHSHKYTTLICLFLVATLLGCGSTSSEETVDELTEASGNDESPSNPLPSDVNETLTDDLQVPMAALPSNPGLRTPVLDGNALTSNTSYKFNIPTAPGFAYSFGRMKTVPVGDLTGDGVDDLAFTEDRDLYLSKQSIIIPGRTGGWPELQQPGESFELPTDTISLPYSFSNSIGDINNDGRDDLVILPQQYQSDDFRTFVALDAKAINEEAESLLKDGATALQIEIPGRIIHHIEGIGDSNGDGIDDFVVYLGFSRTAMDQPQAYVVQGRDNEFPSVLNLDVPQDGVVPIRITATTTGYAEVHAVGDVNGDGLADFLLAYSLPKVDEGAPDHFDSPWWSYGSGDDYASSFLNVIVTGREWKNTSAIVVSDQPINAAGIYTIESERVLVPLGDVTGDRLNDLFVAWGDSLTTLQILPGSTDYASVQDNLDVAYTEVEWQIPRSITDRFYGEAARENREVISDRRSTVIEGVGDLDGDGIGDIVVYHSTNGDYYHWPLGQYYVLYGQQENHDNVQQYHSSTLVTGANGSPVAVGDIDNDGITDLGITQAAYIVERNADSLDLLTDADTGKLALSIPPYVDGYAGGNFDHPTGGSIVAQVLPSPGLQEKTVSDTWIVDLNEVDTRVDAGLLTQLVNMLEATEFLDPETNNPLNWQVDEFSTLPDNSLPTISIQQSSGSIQTTNFGPPINTHISIDQAQLLTVSATRGYYSARTFWTHQRNCEIDLTNSRVLKDHFQCRDALAVAIARLKSWQ